MTRRQSGLAANLEQKRAALPLDQISDDGTFSGYASIFGVVDLGSDKVEKGAFQRSLTTKPLKNVRMLFQHDPAQPIGVWEDIHEDARGLYVKGRITRESARGQEVLGLMRAGAIDGLSIGFKTTKGTTNRTTGVRSITQADLWEISVVTFPMLPAARVDNVKSHSHRSNAQLPSVREFERWLTQDAGLTRSAARTVIGKGFAHLTSKQDAAFANDPRLAGKIRQATRKMNARS